ncbi:PIN domain-containing protein [Dongia deserti]|uniref:PIN domain-containing protein n=1 Tax=Dongia deserti TaxID=2268030 RepID=UPI000E653FB5|nr:hypothetical protein [Dongia deserti]
MALLSSTQIPKTTDPGAFQAQCKVLFEEILGDPNVKENGTSGQSQDGVDLYGRRRNRSLDHWVGIQCKLAIKATKLPRNTVDKEATQALNFNPPLKEFIIVTSAEDDEFLDERARLFTAAQASLGRDFEVQVWGWKTLSTKIIEHERALTAFYPDATPRLNLVLEGVERIELHSKESSTAIIAGIQRLEALTLAHATSQATNSDSAKFDTFIDRQIDQYRDMINRGQPRSALALLEALWNELPADSESRLRFRVKANIGACFLRLGEINRAGTLFLESYEFLPLDPKAIGKKILGLVLLGRAQEAYEIGVDAISHAIDRASIAPSLIFAVRDVESVSSLSDVIPSDIPDDEDIITAKLDFFRSRGHRDEWHRLALESQARFPNNQTFKRFAAEGELDAIFKRQESTGYPALSPSQRDAAITATTQLREIWDETIHHEDAWSDFNISLAANLANGYLLLRQGSQAELVLTQALAHSPNDPNLLRCKLLVALESDDTVTARALIPKLSERNNAIFDLYVRDGVPLALVSTLLGRSTVEFASMLVGHGHDIRACSGTHAEREEALKIAREYRSTGVVLDAHAAWTAYSLKVLPILKALFQRVAIPQSALDEFRNWRNGLQFHGSQPFFTVGFENGRFVREEFNIERVQHAVSTIEAGIREIETNLEVLPAEAPHLPPDISYQLFDIDTKHAFDPIYVSEARKLLLVSEDIGLRAIAAQISSQNGVWLQIILMVALEEGLIDLDTYSLKVSDLGALRHGHITVNGPTIVALAAQSQSDKMEKVGSALAFFGGLNADIDSHMDVALYVMEHIWSAKIAHVRKSKTLGITLERLSALLQQHGTLERSFRFFLQNARPGMELHSYLTNWIRGHFLSL